MPFLDKSYNLSICFDILWKKLSSFCDTVDVVSSVIVCPSGAAWAYYVKVPVNISVALLMVLSSAKVKVTPQFWLGSSHQSLKVRAAVYVPGDPAITI